MCCDTLGLFFVGEGDFDPFLEVLLDFLGFGRFKGVFETESCFEFPIVVIWLLFNCKVGLDAVTF
jgi:hypothetical protein